MKHEHKINMHVGMFLFSSLSLLIISLIDIHQGINLLQISNQIIIEDWLLTFAAVILFIMSIANLFFHQKIEKLFRSRIQLENDVFILMIFLYFIILVFALYDIFKGAHLSAISDLSLYKEEDSIIAIVSIISIAVFFDEFKKGLKNFK